MVGMNKDYDKGSFNNDFDGKSFDSGYKVNDCYDYKESRCNPRWPHYVEIYRESVSGNGNPHIDDDTFMLVLYKGKCRSYRKSGSSYKTEVLTKVRALSIPGYPSGIEINDRVRIQKYDMIEEGYVTDVSPRMNKRGTTIEWDYEAILSR